MSIWLLEGRTTLMNARNHLITSGATAVVLYNAFHHLAPDSFADVPLTLAGAGYLLDHTLLLLAPPILLMKLAYYGGISFGALWPDIDIETSTISRRLPWISIVYRAFFSHRTFTHSCLGTVIGCLLGLLTLLLGIPFLTTQGLLFSPWLVPSLTLFLIAINVGCLLHIWEDSMTIAGVRWFWPAKTAWHFLFFRFRSGGATEHLLVMSYAAGIGALIFFHTLVF